MHLALVEIESGLALGSVYALLAVSLTFTYRVSGIVQLAQGDIMMCGAYAGYFVATQSASFPLVVLVGALTAGLLGYIAYKGAFRWLLSSGHLPPLVVGLALSTAIEEVLRISFFQGNARSFPKLSWISGMGTTSLYGLVIGVALVVGLAFDFWMRKTRLGRDLRATADNSEMARILGVSAERMRAVAFTVGAALAGVGGILVAIVYQSISFDNGGTLEFVAIACILFGGLGSIPGALAGAAVIGLGEALISTYVSSSYVNAMVFGLVLIVIVARPSGILGTERAVRA